ncbi:hypothetical protein EIKCOROL_01280 [Eikenella corrodens ATCC 23834]|uniref:Uncharacterized protein n=1 Tax=Eikenella corrodens ATCC 23834 TaxID=546274 RepID=C0DV91_EIKCO|nr:hypothetical protein EIKCOROL_01280 [Eikenella corrodens ATCC 23834]
MPRSRPALAGWFCLFNNIILQCGRPTDSAGPQRYYFKTFSRHHLNQIHRLPEKPKRVFR